MEEAGETVMVMMMITQVTVTAMMPDLVEERGEGEVNINLQQLRRMLPRPASRTMRVLVMGDFHEKVEAMSSATFD